MLLELELFLSMSDYETGHETEFVDLLKLQASQFGHHDSIKTLTMTVNEGDIYMHTSVSLNWRFMRQLSVLYYGAAARKQKFIDI